MSYQLTVLHPWQSHMARVLQLRAELPQRCPGGDGVVYTTLDRERYPLAGNPNILRALVYPYDVATVPPLSATCVVTLRAKNDASTTYGVVWE